MEQRSVKRLELLPRSTSDLHPVQFLRPLGARRPRSLFERRTVRYLPLEVPPRLLHRNERHANTHVDRAHIPRENRIPAEHGLLTCYRLARVQQGAVLRARRRRRRRRPKRDERRIEARDEVPAEASSGVRPDDEVLPLGIGPCDLARGGVDSDAAGRVREV